MLKLLIPALAVLLVGCNPSYENKDASYRLPPEMQDCKIYKINGDAISRDVIVVRCPNSQTTTSYKYGKNSQSHATAFDEGY